MRKVFNMRGVVVLALCVGALSLAACGGDDDETTTSTTSTTTGATGTSGATGEEGSDTTTGDTTTSEDAPEGTADVQDLLETAFTAQGFSEGEAQCVAEIVAPQVSGEQLSDVEDPSYVEGLLQDSKDEIQDCKGK